MPIAFIELQAFKIFAFGILTLRDGIIDPKGFSKIQCVVSPFTPASEMVPAFSQKCMISMRCKNIYCDLQQCEKKPRPLGDWAKQNIYRWHH